MAAFVAVVPPLATLVITLLPALIPLFVRDIPLDVMVILFASIVVTSDPLVNMAFVR